MSQLVINIHLIVFVVEGLLIGFLWENTFQRISATSLNSVYALQNSILKMQERRCSCNRFQLHLDLITANLTHKGHFNRNSAIRLIIHWRFTATNLNRSTSKPKFPHQFSNSKSLFQLISQVNNRELLQTSKSNKIFYSDANRHIYTQTNNHTNRATLSDKTDPQEQRTIEA